MFTATTLMNMSQSKRNVPDDVLDVLKDVYSPIASVVDEAWSIWQSMLTIASQSTPQFSADNRTVGTAMNNLLRALFREKASQLGPVVFIETDDLFFLVVNKNIVLRFNMMDKDGNTDYIDTKQAKKYLHEELEIPGFEPLKYLYAGYLMGVTKSDLANFYILKRARNKRPVWILDKYHTVLQQGILNFAQTNKTQSQTTGIQKPKRATAKDGNTKPATGTDGN